MGLRLIGNYVYVTDTGVTIDAKNKSNDGLQHWSSAEPNGGSAEVNVEFVGYLNLNYWNDIREESDWSWVLNIKYATICVKDPAYHKAKNGKYYRMFYKNVTAIKAKSICTKRGAQLASIYQPADLNATGFLMQQFYRVSDSVTIKGFWIAGSDVVAEGKWVMPDGTVLDVANNGTDVNQHWGSGFPNKGSSGNCLQIYSDFASGAMAWIDVACDAIASAFACEISA
jgi:hypothetical protein